MATKEPTTVKVTGKTSNPRDIAFPHDDAGFTTLLRKEGVRAAGRVKGDADKLKVFLETLKVLGEHAKAKVEADNAEKTARAKAAEVREAQEKARKLEDTKRELARLESVIDHTAKTRDALAKAAGLE